METKPLLFGIVGFLMGGLLVSTAAFTMQQQTPAGPNSVMATLSEKSGAAYDRAFVAAMIEHHQGAIDMAELSGSRAQHDEIKQLSQEIIATQTPEIDQLRQWQRDWGYGPDHSPDASTTH